MALFIAMTVGSLALMVLETEPVRPAAQPLAVLSPPPDGAAAVIYDTQATFRAGAWRHVVVHASRDASSDLAAACHFLVVRDGGGEGHVVATDLWRRQLAGRHIGGVWRDGGIGVCLIGDFAREAPGGEQFEALTDLVNTLQELCRIPADRVYLHSDLVARSTSPGAAFPAAKFAARLLRPQR